jgi:hypothetical protein
MRRALGHVTEVARLTARRSTAARSAFVDSVAWCGLNFRTLVLHASRSGSPSAKRIDFAKLPMLGEA